MHAPQIILIIIYAMGFGITLVKHGQPREETYNIWSFLISLGIQMGLLIWGGFFSH